MTFEIHQPSHQGTSRNIVTFVKGVMSYQVFFCLSLSMFIRLSAGGVYTAPPNPLAGIKGTYF